MLSACARAIGIDVENSNWKHRNRAECSGRAACAARVSNRARSRPLQLALPGVNVVKEMLLDNRQLCIDFEATLSGSTIEHTTPAATRQCPGASDGSSNGARRSSWPTARRLRYDPPAWSACRRLTCARRCISAAAIGCMPWDCAICDKAAVGEGYCIDGAWYECCGDWSPVVGCSGWWVRPSPSFFSRTPSTGLALLGVVVCWCILLRSRPLLSNRCRYKSRKR